MLANVLTLYLHKIRMYIYFSYENLKVSNDPQFQNLWIKFNFQNYISKLNPYHMPCKMLHMQDKRFMTCKIYMKTN